MENAKLGTIDFQLEDDDASPVIFRTCPSQEKHALVFQMGTSEAKVIDVDHSDSKVAYKMCLCNVILGFLNAKYKGKQ